MKIAFLDIEVSANNKIISLASIDENGECLYVGDNIQQFYDSVKDYDILGGHNILQHDLKFLKEIGHLPEEFFKKKFIDTLWISSLIFIRKPYHKLIKYYKDLSEEQQDDFERFFIKHQPGIDKNDHLENNPLEDSRLSLQILKNCVTEFLRIDSDNQKIFYTLLKNTPEFGGFFEYLDKNEYIHIDCNIHEVSKIIENKLHEILQTEFFRNELPNILKYFTLEFVFIYRLVEANLTRDKTLDKDCSILPFWVNYTLKKLSNIFKRIFKYKIYNAQRELKSYFGYKSFKVYNKRDGTKLRQQDIVESGFKEENFLAILATGGGKSICFQLPAISRSECTGFLTLVISPLQSLMDDQVNTLKNNNITQQVGALHSGLDPFTRKEIVEKVREGGINLLYLSPEMLRSPSTKKLLEKRYIDRIVIDEAHCFSKWGHDFRIDYMFIADFLKELSKYNYSIQNTNISCFTATAKEEVIDEIQEYFKQEPFSTELKLFKSTSKRENLHYRAIEIKEPDDKKISLNGLKIKKLVEIIEKEVGNQPCIIFTRYTGAGDSKNIGAKQLSEEINQRLINDGYGDIQSEYFHGKMKGDVKKQKMNAFMNGEINIMVATNAFGMGVDKNNVRYVIHYNVPNSLENYLQEAGRAGRDSNPSECIILYTNKDLDENLQLNKSSEVKPEELRKLLNFLKKKLNTESEFKMSARNLIQSSHWIAGDFDEERKNNHEILSTKISTAISFLERPFIKEKESYFIKRGLNRTRIYATSTQQENMNDIWNTIMGKEKLDQEEYEKLQEIYKLISLGKALSIEDIPHEIGRHMTMNFSDDIKQRGVRELVKILQKYKLVEQDDQEITIQFNKNDNSLEKNGKVRNFINEMFSILKNDGIGKDAEHVFDKRKISSFLCKKLGDISFNTQIDSFLNVLKDRYWIRAKFDNVLFLEDISCIQKTLNLWLDLGEKFILSVYSSVSENQKNSKKDVKQRFNSFIKQLQILVQEIDSEIKFTSIDVENFLKFLVEFGIIEIEGGLFLYHTDFTIKKGEHFNEKFTEEHAEALATFYKNKTNQAHFMEEFVKNLLKGRGDANLNNFVEDYFNLTHEDFIERYFKGREGEIGRPISKIKHDEIWNVTEEQKKILDSKKNLLALAGPGSGKTRSLVHKVANLILEERVSKNEFLLLTFMRSAKFELKKRIVDLIGNQGYYLQIHTFHGFCYELLGRDPLKEDFDTDGNENNKIIKDAIVYLNKEEKILPYRVIMIDEFQDIGEDHFKLIEAISRSSQFDEKKIRIIAVGDDDQSIMGFNGANIKYIQNFKERNNAEEVVLSKNFRSTQTLIDYTTTFIEQITNRLKQGIKLIADDHKGLFIGESKIETRNCQGNCLLGVVEALDTIQSKKEKETTAIICYENETVLQLNHILQKKGIKAQILLGQLGYKLRDTLELRYFLEICKDTAGDPLTNENIRDKYNAVLATYGENKNTDTLKQIITTILKTNSKISPKIIEDFLMDFKDESDLIDEEHQLFISTFHKAKGREFDNVIICFDRDQNWDNKIDEKIRLIYVGMTRAKKNLIILGNKDHNRYFHFLYEHAPIKQEKNYKTEDIDEISIITMPGSKPGDIYLSYNNDEQNNNIKIGAEIQRKEEIKTTGEKIIDFYYEGKSIQKSSKNLVPKLSKWISKEYQIISVRIFQKIIFCDENKKEHLVFLFEITLKKIPQAFKDIEKAKDKINELEEEIQILQERGDDALKLEAIIKERNTQIIVLQEKTSLLEKKLAHAKNIIISHEQNIQENVLTIKQLQDKLSLIIEEKENIEATINDLETDLREARKQGNQEIVKEFESKLENAQNQLKETEFKLNNTTQEKEVREERNQQLEDENNNLKRENEELSKKINDIKQTEQGNKGHIFKVGEGEKLKEFLIKQIQTANKSVVIIDPYMDMVTFELLGNRKIGIKGEIRYEKNKTLKSLGGNINRLTELLKNKEDQEGNPIIVRSINTLHDRFLIIDDIVRQVGTSMNSTLGTNVTTIQRIKNPKEEILDAYRK